MLGYPGQVSLSLLPAAEPRPLETILAALVALHSPGYIGGMYARVGPASGPLEAILEALVGIHLG